MTDTYTSADGYAYTHALRPETESDRFQGVHVTLPDGTTQLVSDTQIRLIAEALALNPLRTRVTRHLADLATTLL